MVIIVAPIPKCNSYEGSSSPISMSSRVRSPYCWWVTWCQLLQDRRYPRFLQSWKLSRLCLASSRWLSLKLILFLLRLRIFLIGLSLTRHSVSIIHSFLDFLDIGYLFCLRKRRIGSSFRASYWEDRDRLGYSWKKTEIYQSYLSVLSGCWLS